jgi:hypothetical protein
MIYEMRLFEMCCALLNLVFLRDTSINVETEIPLKGKKYPVNREEFSSLIHDDIS